VPLILRNLALDFRENEHSAREKLLARFSLGEDELGSFRILRKSLDARKKSSIKYIYTIEFAVADETAFLARFGNDADIQVVGKKQ